MVSCVLGEQLGALQEAAERPGARSRLAHRSSPSRDLQLLGLRMEKKGDGRRSAQDKTGVQARFLRGRREPAQHPGGGAGPPLPTTSLKSAAPSGGPCSKLGVAREQSTCPAPPSPPARTLMEMKLAPLSCATALATSVLPHPGGPYSNTPCATPSTHTCSHRSAPQASSTQITHTPSSEPARPNPRRASPAAARKSGGAANSPLPSACPAPRSGRGAGWAA